MQNYWTLTIRPLVIYCLVPVFLGSSVAAVGWYWQSDSSAFVENLHQTEGRIVRTEPAGGGTNLDIEFATRAGVLYTHRFGVSASEAERLQAIGKIILVYDQRDPRRAEIGNVVRAHSEMQFDWSVFALGLFLIGVGVWVAARRALQILGIYRLFRSGQMVQTEVRESALAPGGQIGRFTYAFRGPNGRWFEGKSPELSAGQLAAWPVGRPLLAAYDPRDPRRSEADIFGVAEERRRELPQSV